MIRSPRFVLFLFIFLTHSSPYKLLEVNTESSLEEIKKAFRSKARENHPDKACQNVGGEEKISCEESASEKFAEIRHAYEVLTDPKTRQ